MNVPLQISNKLSQIGIVLAIVLSTLLVDGLVVAWLWVVGVDFAIMDRVVPGESGFHINPLSNSYKWLLGVILVIYSTLLFLQTFDRPLVVGAAILIELRP
ncbi:hypothetical protein ACFQ48_21515, partial [Hymenobacter caeli]